MYLDEKQIRKNQKRLSKLSTDIKNKSIMHHIASNPTRLKIIFLLKKNQKLCVSELAMILNISISAVSHQLNLLEAHHIVKSKNLERSYATA